jgi:predicted MFS family arabinose efflux permease
MISVSLFLAFVLGYFLTQLFRVVNAVAGPAVSAELGLDVAEFGFVTSFYFLSYAAIQLPLGVLLDRYGPNRVEGTLLLIAAVGTTIFALSDSITTLTIGRLLMGLGVSSGLMAAFKAFSALVPPERLPLINGLHMAAGSLGVLAAGLPVELAIEAFGWRGFFIGLAGIAAFGSLVLLFGVRGIPATHGGESFGAMVRGAGKIIVSAPFIRIAPIAAATQSSMMALQALWVGPFLRDVAGFTPAYAATVVSLMGIAVIAGYGLSAFLGDRLVRRYGVPVSAVMLGGCLMVFTMQIGIILVDPALSAPFWIGFALFGTFTALSYPALGRYFPVAQTGRVNTSLNFLLFVGGFVLQWSFGVVVERLTPAWGLEAAYDGAFLSLVALQAAGYVWYAIRRPAAPSVAAV